MFGKKVVPSCGGCLVAKVHSGKLIFEHIPAKISREEDPVVLVNGMIDLCIEIIEIQPAFLKVFIIGKYKEKISICPSSRDDE